MKSLAIAASTVLSAIAIAAPAQASLFSYDIEYTGWWEEGGSIFGSITAPEEAATDGFIDATELESWTWDWTGNDIVSAFSISSSDLGAGVSFLEGFFVDGTSNLPGFADGVDQGTFSGGELGEYVVDLEFLLVEDNTLTFPNFSSEFVEGDITAAAGQVTVSEPTAIPEPTAVLGLLAIAGIGATIKRKQPAA